MTKLEEMEQKFLHFTKLNLDLTIFPIKESPTQQKDKTKSDNFGEVFTPIWLVDKMVQEVPIEDLYQKRATLDLCAGYGQFTIRMMRALYNYKNGDFDVCEWLKEVHTMIEIQPGSCFKLLEIFGTDINLFIGDACHLPKAEKSDGTQLWNGSKWQKIANISKVVNDIKNEYQTDLGRECCFILRLMRGLLKTEKKKFLEVILSGVTKENKELFKKALGIVLDKTYSEKEKEEFVQIFKQAGT